MSTVDLALGISGAAWITGYWDPHPVLMFIIVLAWFAEFWMAWTREGS